MNQSVMMINDLELEEVNGGWVVAIPIAIAICTLVGAAAQSAWDRGYQVGKDLAASSK